MKLLSFALAGCRHFSAQAAALEKQNWAKNYVSGKKSKSDGNRFRTPRKPRKWTDEQTQVLEAVRDGKSVFITGSAGTGKTFLLEHVIRELKKMHGRSKVYVTASTGVAACALSGQTLHSFAGIGMGFDNEDYKSLLDRVVLDVRARYRWKKVKALCIDEISMVDAKTFEGLAYLARSIRSGEASECANKTWGGIQLVVCGDFFQLPPVLKIKKAKKLYAFEADCWNSSFDAQVELTTVFRQSDSLLVQLLQGMRRGESNSDDLKLLVGCCGREPDPSAVRLFPRVEDVKRVNKEKLESLGQKIYVYRAQDLGDEKWIKQFKNGIVPDELELCIGARVMLVKNINPYRKLVNGTSGTVKKLVTVCKEKCGMYDMCSEGSILPLVEFDSGAELVVEPETWVVVDGDKIVARRRQVPLIGAYALSVHKCQGMTLDKLHTDLSQVFGFGMVYVALSRVRNFEGLSLSGLDPSKVKADPKVSKFYDTSFKPKKREVIIGSDRNEIGVENSLKCCD